MSHHACFQGIKLLLRKVSVYVSSENLVRTERLAHYCLIFGRSSGMLARFDDHRSAVGKNAFTSPGNLLIKFRGREVPVDRGWPSEAVVTELVVGISYDPDAQFLFPCELKS